MYLVIDASVRKTLVAYGEKKRIVAHQAWAAGFKLSQELLPAIEKILARRPRPQAIFCVSGPGSFTGLRVAVSTANALGYAWRIPVVPVEAFEIYEATRPNLQPPYEVVLDNIKDLVYVKRVSAGKACYTVEKVKSEKEKVKSGKVLGHVSISKQDSLGIKNTGVRAVDLSGKNRAKLICQVSQSRMGKKNGFTQPITPLYINAPHITLKK